MIASEWVTLAQDVNTPDSNHSFIVAHVNSLENTDVTGLFNVHSWPTLKVYVTLWSGLPIFRDRLYGCLNTLKCIVIVYIYEAMLYILIDLDLARKVPLIRLFLVEIWDTAFGVCPELIYASEHWNLLSVLTYKKKKSQPLCSSFRSPRAVEPDLLWLLLCRMHGDLMYTYNTSGRQSQQMFRDFGNGGFKNVYSRRIGGSVEVFVLFFSSWTIFQRYYGAWDRSSSTSS